MRRGMNHELPAGGGPVGEEKTELGGVDRTRSPSPDMTPLITFKTSDAEEKPLQSDTSPSVEDTQHVTKTMSVLLCLFYGVASFSLGFINKALLTVFQYRYLTTVMTTQALFTLLILLVCKSMRWVSFPDVGPSIIRKVWPLATVNLINVIFGLAGLRLVNIPMFLVLRRTTTLIVMFLEYIILRKVASPQIRWSLGVVMLGALIAGAADLTFDLWGYIFIMCNNLFTALYLILIKKINESTKLNSFGLLFYNSLLSLPPLVVLVLLLGETSQLSTYEYFNAPGFWMLFCATGSMGFVLNLAIFLCTTHNSALATSVTGNVKDIVSTGLGLFAFGDFRVSFFNIVGLCISMMGSMWYSYVKLNAGVPGSKTPSGTVGKGEQRV